jgi:hypothetical protein
MIKNRFVVEGYQNPFRPDDYCNRLVDTVTGEEVGSDGGEPEDQTLTRDWRWVTEALNHYNQEWASKVERLELDLAVAKENVAAYVDARDRILARHAEEVKSLEEEIDRLEQDEICPLHETAHGGEAEELRKGIENLLADGEHTDEWPEELQRLLDRVDACDSLVYVETISSLKKKLADLETESFSVLLQPSLKDWELELTAKILDLASDEFANHGCNDLNLEQYGLPPETIENLHVAMAAYNGAPDERQHGKYTMDWYLMGYLAYRLRGNMKRPRE